MKYLSKRIAIVTQDPANYGGVLRLVEYVYRRAVSAELEPTILHYAKYAEHPELHASINNFFRGELTFAPKKKDYAFRGMNARAIGAWFPEWEPQRVRSNALWRRTLSEFDSYILITGSAQTGLPLVEEGKKFSAWVSSTVEDDRRERLARSHGMSTMVERLGLTRIISSESETLKASSSLMTVSEYTREQLSSVTNRPSEVWPFPVDTDKFSPGTAQYDSRSRFLFVGRANDPRKRIALFFAACSALTLLHPELDFSATVVSQALQLPTPVSFPIECVTSASEEALIEHYRTATALVLTSEQEGLGIAAMEAMACGLPVISTRCGGPETFIEDGTSGFFVEDNPEAIANRMYAVAANASLRMAIGNAARARIENHFSEHVWNRKFENMLQENK